MSAIPRSLRCEPSIGLHKRLQAPGFQSFRRALALLAERVLGGRRFQWILRRLGIDREAGVDSLSP